ncbi:MAG: hypothetical protein JWQ52_1315 [Phenylobacterium sp.]|jgi:hypothetical protein|nr:hypothetical protein [Phenylobacterium sp.]
MKLHYLLGAVAASALMTGAAYAQAGSSAQPTTGATTDPTVPAPAGSSSTTMPSGPVNSSVSTDTTGASTTTTTDTTSTGATANSATNYAQGASVTTTTLTNGPIPDTPENRAKYGKPMSHAGKRSPAKGN